MEDECMIVLLIAAAMMIGRPHPADVLQRDVNEALDAAAALLNEAKRRSPELRE